MNYIAIGLVSFFGALLSALGMGGGGILVIYLTLVNNLPQLGAQGMNTAFFVPIAAVSLVIHIKNKLVVYKVLPPIIFMGLIGVYCGSKLAIIIGSDNLGKIFGVFLLLVGIRQLLPDKNIKNSKKS